MDYYGTLKQMHRIYQNRSRQDAFIGTNYTDFHNWQSHSRQTLYKLLKMDAMEECSRKIINTDSFKIKNGILLEKFLLQTEPEIYMPFYKLTPENCRMHKEKKQCYIALHGHQGGGKDAVAGIRTNLQVAEKINFFNYDYGLQLAERGYIVFCPDARGFGERRDEAWQNEEKNSILKSSCYQLGHMAESMGMTVIGMLTWDLMRFLDYICTLQDIDTETIGCLGFSGGGMQALYLSALDARIDTTVISGYMYGFLDSLLTLNGNCSCNYVPNLFLHFDMGDIASLIAPRKLLIQSCLEDHLNGPRGMANVTEQMEILQCAYHLTDFDENLFHDIRPGGHHFHSEILDYINDAKHHL